MDEGSPYVEAVEKIAVEKRVRPSTVRAACTRNLGIGTKKFVELAEKENRFSLILLLQKRFPSHNGLIEREIGKKQS